MSEPLWLISVSFKSYTIFFYFIFSSFLVPEIARSVEY